MASAALRRARSGALAALVATERRALRPVAVPGRRPPEPAVAVPAVARPLRARAATPARAATRAPAVAARRGHRPAATRAQHPARREPPATAATATADRP